MLRLAAITSRSAIEAYLRRDAALHLYALGDLDPFFWPHTRWWGLEDAAGELWALVLLYHGAGTPTLLALDRQEPSLLPELLHRLRGPLGESQPGGDELCRLGEDGTRLQKKPVGRLHAHLSPGLAPALAPAWRATEKVSALKLALTRPSRLTAVPGLDEPDLRPVTREDLPAMEAFYAESYPGNWFDPRMLETGYYVGLWREGLLAAAAGIHVISPSARVAALGNIATHPKARRLGHARRVTARLCRDLLRDVDIIGLNVYARNAAALSLYADLGFTLVVPYEEWSLTRIP